MQRKLTKSFMELPLKNKLIIYSAVLTIIPVIIVGFFSYTIASNALTDKVSKSTIVTVEQIAKSVEFFMNDIEDLSVIILSDDSIQKLLKIKDENSEEYNEVLDKAYKTLFNITNSKKYISFACVSKNFSGKQYYVGPPVVVDVKNFSNESWYDEVINMDGKAFWTDTYKNTFFTNIDPNIFSLVRSINDNYRVKTQLGILLINLKEEALYKFYGSNSKEKNSEVFIVNGKGEIVSHRDKSLILTKIKDEKYVKGLQDKEKGVFIYHSSRDNQLITHCKIQNTDWIIVSSVSMNELLKENKIIRELTILIMLVSIIITFLISVYMASTISKPLAKLLSQMKKVSEGNFDIQVQFHHGDEINQLGQGFNSMVVKIEKLVYQMYVDQKRQKEIELKALQSQINPHFLYNTLESINWMAQEIKAKEISTMVISLAKFFRISISRGKDIIPLRDEIEHIRNYLIIQKIRYQELLNAKIIIDDNILNYKLPKLILQPLVENSIYHGIKNKKGRGDIIISGRKENDCIILEVIDNGIGMNEEEIQQINYSLNNPQIEGKMGYGVRNVHERITLRFGKEYGLIFYRNPEGGTKVEVRLPACDELEG